MRTAWCKSAACGAALALVGGCASYPDEAETRAGTEKIIATSFTAPSPALLKRLDQDRMQQLCSTIGDNKLSQAQSEQVIKLARASIQYPASGKLVGDWKVGEKLAHDGAGDRIARGQLEKRKENGGLCQNCHALAPGEVNVGNVGPPLTHYGVSRGNSAEMAKYTYDRIYNAWVYTPCSNMPRLGATRHLTPEQITHLVAYLIEPQSPLNR